MSGPQATDCPDLTAIRAGIPALARQVHDKPLIYLDAAATTPRPQVVIDAVSHYEATFPANVHRGVHTLSGEATEAYESARRRIAAFLGGTAEQLVFTRGTTEAINLVANAWGRSNLGPGDEVLISAIEHHANIVPWQLVCEAKGAVLRVAPVDDDGELHVDAVKSALSDKTTIVAMTAVSNALGTVTPIREICALARQAGALSVVDAAQAVPHMPVQLDDIGCDALAFSGHKMYAPTGIGGLMATPALLEDMNPWQGGGDMIATVSFEKSTWNSIPWKFEAGTPNVAGTVGLGAAVDWLSTIGMDCIARRETALLDTAVTRLESIDRVNLVGHPAHRAGAVSFLVDGLHPADLGAMLDRHGIAIRTGHHCAQPVMDRFGVTATARIAPAFYNTESELEAFESALRSVIDVFG